MRCAVGALVVLWLTNGIILAIGPKDYPHLHTMLDASTAQLSGVLALLLWDMGTRAQTPFYKQLAAAFAITAALEGVHILVAVEWSGPLAAIAEAERFLRPATWPPAAHLLPLAMAAALWQLHRGRADLCAYALAIAGAAIALFAAFQVLPAYTPPVLGITRPALVAAPLLWLAIGAWAYRLRELDRILPPLVLMAGALALANLTMLFSVAPADGPAMAAHLGKLSAYLVLLLCVMQMASVDMVERTRAEAALAQLNRDLELRVRDRTADLVTANEALRVEAEQRQLADEGLRRSTALLQATFDAAPFPISVMAPDKTVLMWNRAAEKVLGYSADDSVNRYYPSVLKEDREDAFSNHFQRALAGESLPAASTQLTAQNGKVLDIDFNCAAVPATNGNMPTVVCVLEDVTQKNAIEAQLRQAQKMEAIGNLTGGLAHDFNNLLGVIIGNLELAAPVTAAKGSSEIDEMIGESLDAALRGADLTRRLLAFARQQPLQPALLQMNELVAGMVRLLGRTLGENIEISLDLASDVWPVVADPAQFEAAIVNLATNARDAMPRGGRLMLATSNRRLDADYAVTHPGVIPGDYALVEVTDTGTGIPPEALEHVFEPFFTTKERGRGTGLGLSMVFGFMKQSGGHITVYSEPSAGATFRLYLPRATAGAELGESEAMQAAPKGGGETILVVEDNDALRRVSLRQIRAMGYRALEADGPAAAFAHLEREKVDLLFSDVVMPGGVDGFTLAREAASRWPALKIVLTSGFPETRLIDNMETSSVRLLSKPYRSEELGSLLREVLDQ